MPLVNKTLCLLTYNITQLLFVLIVAFFCIVSLTIRLYFMPHAQESRLKDFSLMLTKFH